MSEITLIRLKERFGFKTDKQFAAALGIAQGDFGNRKRRDTLLKLIALWAAKNGHDISDILRSADAAPTTSPPAPCTEGPNVSNHITGHQALVARFEQKHLAERINRVLLDIEQLAPDRLEEILAELEAKRAAIERSRAAKGPPAKMRAGGE